MNCQMWGSLFAAGGMQQRKDVLQGERGVGGMMRARFEPYQLPLQQVPTRAPHLSKISVPGTGLTSHL